MRYPSMLEHLSETDRQTLERLARATGDASGPPGDVEALSRLLSRAEVFDALFGRGEVEELLLTSPFLTFAVVVHRGWAELAECTHVREWVGPRQRLPVLSAGELREFLDDPERRFFLAELLASYTRVASGSTWVRTRRGWRRRRWSELDPLRLAELLEVLPEREHAGVYRRLGDLALFLTGVFPDHTELAAFGRHEVHRLRVVAGLDPGPGERPLPGTAGAVALLEHLGTAWYRQARRRAAFWGAAGVRILDDVADRFAAARRTLNHLTDRYLFAQRTRWFGRPAG